MRMIVRLKPHGALRRVGDRPSRPHARRQPRLGLLGRGCVMSRMVTSLPRKPVGPPVAWGGSAWCRSGRLLALRRDGSDPDVVCGLVWVGLLLHGWARVGGSVGCALFPYS